MADHMPGCAALRCQAASCKKAKDSAWKEIRRVERVLGDGREICSRCGATLNTFADQCTADLAEPCPGFISIKQAREGEG